MEQFRLEKQRRKHHYDMSTKHLKQVNKDNVVKVKDAWTRKSTVTQEVAPRSSTVKTEDGKILWHSLLQTAEAFQPPTKIFELLWIVSISLLVLFVAKYLYKRASEVKLSIKKYSLSFLIFYWIDVLCYYSKERGMCLYVEMLVLIWSCTATIAVRDADV